MGVVAAAVALTSGATAPGAVATPAGRACCAAPTDTAIG